MGNLWAVGDDDHRFATCVEAVNYAAWLAAPHRDELGYLHNHELGPGNRPIRYRSACPGCDEREDEHP